mgnify:CR=1 FL=1
MVNNMYEEKILQLLNFQYQLYIYLILLIILYHFYLQKLYYKYTIL